MQTQAFSNSTPFSVGRNGGGGFRSDAIPIIILVTDNWSAYRHETPQPLDYVGYGLANGRATVPADFLTGRNPVTGVLRPRVVRPWAPPNYNNGDLTRQESGIGNEAQIQKTIDALTKLGAFVIPVFPDHTLPQYPR